MLVLSRRKGETIMIGEDIQIKIIRIERDEVRLGIQAPRELRVDRSEVYFRRTEERHG